MKPIQIAPVTRTFSNDLMAGINVPVATQETVHPGDAYSLADDWQLLLVWQHFDGSSDSFFGENPTDMVYGRVRWSF